MIYFPHPLSSDKEGLLAVGGDLNVERLELAYKFGIFPWYNQKPILWWFTGPRSVIYPAHIKISKSMKSLVNFKLPWQVTMDQNFRGVIDKCAKISRPNQYGTWITGEMRQAYIQLHHSGMAHSLEVWQDDDMIGGLYGVASGKIFFGESMFSNIANTSKYALIHLARYLDHMGCTLIDCQQDTSHMRSMGATLISKNKFWEIIKSNVLVSEMNLNADSFEEWIQVSYQNYPRS